LALNITSRQVEGITVLSCDGRIDFGEDAGALRTSVKSLIPGTPRIIVDLEHATHMDSGGLGVMVSLYCSARAAGTDIKLANLGARLKGVLQITKLVTVFEVYDTVEQAITAFRQGAGAPAGGTG
jgi:anti-sigma B factor antagonist